MAAPIRSHDSARRCQSRLRQPRVLGFAPHPMGAVLRALDRNWRGAVARETIDRTVQVVASVGCSAIPDVGEDVRLGQKYDWLLTFRFTGSCATRSCRIPSFSRESIPEMLRVRLAMSANALDDCARLSLGILAASIRL